VGYNSNLCANDDAGCSVDGDCCNFPNSRCILGTCKATPDLGGGTGNNPLFNSGNFSRDYEGSCPDGTETVWRFFDWKSQTPSDSKIVFHAQTADTQAALGGAPNTLIGTAQGAPAVNWTGVYVDDLLPNKDSKHWLRISMDLVPSSDRTQAPTLTDWRMSYSCEAAK
jgi:hypothetical protein